MVKINLTPTCFSLADRGYTAVLYLYIYLSSEENRRWNTTHEQLKFKESELKSQLQRQTIELEMSKKKLSRLAKDAEEAEKIRANDKITLRQLREQLADYRVEVGFKFAD